MLVSTTSVDKDPWHHHVHKKKKKQVMGLRNKTLAFAGPLDTV
jgi:hypothetical protein